MAYKDLRDRAIYWKNYYESNKEEILVQRRKGYQLNREERRRQTAERHKRLKKEVLTHYAHGKCVCVMCGESDLICLSIDHIHGNGTKHRQQLGTKGRGHNFYSWLKNNNYPPEYQTLCMNCQFKKRDKNKECNLSSLI